MPDARIPTKLAVLVDSIEQQLQREPEISLKSKTVIHDLLAYVWVANQMPHEES